MIGLGNTYQLSGKHDKGKILDELLWGNQYFLKMQEPQGYIMNFIGGDVRRHSDSNRWTDNISGTDEGKLELTTPTAGKSMTKMLVFGKKDDRVIDTSPCDIVTQYQFIASEAMMSRITKGVKYRYSRKCLQAALKCFEWTGNSRSKYESTPSVYGAVIKASIELYKATRNNIYKNYATEQASMLKQLQADNPADSISGFFHTSVKNNAPYKEILGSIEFISLCDLAFTFPKHKDAHVWKEMISGYVNKYLLTISQKNSFGIVPFGIYDTVDPGGNRKIGRYWYRYFMQPELDWWVGINANVASAGIGLAKASIVLKDKALRSYAQKQLDWIIGVNPFNSSTIVNVGYNHPPAYMPSSFEPHTPILPGAVMNGLGGDHSDQPYIGEGNWQVSEYWTPMAAYALWLMAEISAEK
jgi:hypothetical protein